MSSETEYLAEIAKLEEKNSWMEQRIEELESEIGEMNYVPNDPIGVAKWLIEASFEYEILDFLKPIFKKEKEVAKRYSISDLEQIAKHLLVYCEHATDEERNH